ncbi:MAG TPA: short-chain dehydrogenase/reductase [Verrucomicrobiales bacterium]|nr:short-chain dehydrogenase/reductase [Verrucomicrobiales bacterium]HRJ09956.1 SDR family NAD(P)-dependent oxidoreductase [Prosthecobacter sp.]HRK14058.1 SDR family NAD(P)-dependent oxidoreductase [Prosthecobacter sp.]
MKQKTWLITGCSRGLGRAIAEAALEAGQRVIATARDASVIADLEKPSMCEVMTLDVTDQAQARDVVAASKPDVIVNNAGQGLLGAVEECGEEQIRRCMETNFHGPLNVIRAALPGLRSRRSGHIINISAAAAISNYAGFGIYGAAKGALEMLSESLRLELAPLGIHVTLVQPGPFRTAFISRSLEKAEHEIGDYAASSGKFARLIEGMDGRQPGDPARAARAIMAAASSDKPPMRLVLGRYANEKARRRGAEVEKERAEWEAVGSPCEFTSPA